MPNAILTVTYPDGTSTQQHTSTLPDARRALIKLCNRRRWRIEGTGSGGKLISTAGKLAGCYLIRIREPANGR